MRGSNADNTRVTSLALCLTKEFCDSFIYFSYVIATTIEYKLETFNQAIRHKVFLLHA